MWKQAFAQAVSWIFQLSPGFPSSSRELLSHKELDKSYSENRLVPQRSVTRSTEPKSVDDLSSSPVTLPSLRSARRSASKLSSTERSDRTGVTVTERPLSSLGDEELLQQQLLPEPPSEPVVPEIGAPTRNNKREIVMRIELEEEV